MHKDIQKPQKGINIGQKDPIKQSEYLRRIKQKLPKDNPKKEEVQTSKNIGLKYLLGQPEDYGRYNFKDHQGQAKEQEANRSLVKKRLKEEKEEILA